MMNRRMLPLVVMLGWSVPVVAQPAPNPAVTGDRFQLACAPMRLPATPNQALRVLGTYEHGRLLFGPNDAVVVNAGTNQGLRPGQQYYVRRVVHDRFTGWTMPSSAISIHTSGWVRIDEAQADASVATIVQACDGVMYGDYLEPFADPVLPADTRVTGEPDFDHPAHIAMGDEKRQTGAPGALMMLDQGADHGLRAGQTITIYRAAPRDPMRMTGYGPTLEAPAPTERVGSARVLSVLPQSAVVRIESSREAIYVGDFAAVHRIAP